MANKNIGVILVNVGTPESPSPGAVRVYLKEFLMDPLVVSLPYPFRWLLVHGLIAPFRCRGSADRYHSIWKESGSPLLIHSKSFADKVQRELGADFTVKLAMRYGNPSLFQAIDEFKKKNLSYLLFPLYPQYSPATTQSSELEVCKLARQMKHEKPVTVIPAFFQEEGFISSYALRIEAAIGCEAFDKLLFSFHGLPEKHLRYMDKTESHCLKTQQCCGSLSVSNQKCYRAQCFETARRLATKLGLSQKDYVVAFQSRLGPTAWIKPYAQDLFKSLPQSGVKRLVVASPSFVTDCLETLEEIAVVGKETFLKSGGKSFSLVPCLNESDNWVQAATSLIRKAASEPT